MSDQPRQTDPDPPCPCGSGRPLAACCGPVIAGEAAAATAEALMRSRYSAYVLGDADHLRASWHPTSRPERIELDDQTRWLGLKVLSSTGGGARDRDGTVEFVARYKIGGRAYRLHEISRFLREGGRWTYVGGEAGESDSRVKAAGKRR
jgi:SEC-C motif-containing protein